jgi:hypothetical protein
MVKPTQVAMSTALLEFELMAELNIATAVESAAALLSEVEFDVVFDDWVPLVEAT